jgi:hypothetical protein
MLSYTTPLKGARKDVFETICRQLAAGQAEFSYLDLAVASDYSLPAVLTAVRFLEAQGRILVERRGAGRANRYAIPAGT